MDTQIEQLLQVIRFDQLPMAILILIAGVVGTRFLAQFLDNLGESFTERRLFFKKASALSRFLIYLVLLLVVLTSVLEFRGETLLALGGTLGVALGFGFKDLFASLGAGIILLFDQPFQVGDRVRVDDYYGEVKVIGLRAVRLQTLDDNLVTIPNSRFLSNAVANANAGNLEAMVVIPFYIHPEQDFVMARRIVAEAAATSRYVFLDKPLQTLVSEEYVGFQLFCVIRVKAYVFDVRHEKAFASDVTERVKAAFSKSGIGIYSTERPVHA
jgi:small-conductance mechanosensitive channel